MHGGEILRQQSVADQEQTFEGQVEARAPVYRFDNRVSLRVARLPRCPTAEAQSARTVHGRQFRPRGRSCLDRSPQGPSANREDSAAAVAVPRARSLVIDQQPCVVAQRPLVARQVRCEGSKSDRDGLSLAAAVGEGEREKRPDCVVEVI